MSIELVGYLPPHRPGWYKGHRIDGGSQVHPCGYRFFPAFTKAFLGNNPEPQPYIETIPAYALLYWTGSELIEHYPVK